MNCKAKLKRSPRIQRDKDMGEIICRLKIWKINEKFQHIFKKRKRASFKEIMAENFPELKAGTLRVKKPTVY